MKLIKDCPICKETDKVVLFGENNTDKNNIVSFYFCDNCHEFFEVDPRKNDRVIKINREA